MNISKHSILMTRSAHTRDRPRFYDQDGYQTTNASNGNKHFFTK